MKRIRWARIVEVRTWPSPVRKWAIMRWKQVPYTDYAPPWDTTPSPSV